MTDTLQNAQPASPAPDPTKVRYLMPDVCRIHLGNLGALHVTIKDEGIYGGVYAAYAFPVAHSYGYISLIHTHGEKDVEIGIIRDLNEFPRDAADLVRAALARRYFVHTVTRLNEVSWKYGLIYFDVDTDKGQVRFFMRWAQDRAVDYGKRGKVVIDLDNNRYLIPNLDALSTHERHAFQRYIYW